MALNITEPALNEAKKTSDTTAKIIAGPLANEVLTNLSRVISRKGLSARVGVSEEMQIITITAKTGAIEEALEALKGAVAELREGGKTRI